MPIEGAEVRVTDGDGETLPLMTTDADGMASMILFDYEMNRTQNDTWNPYTFRVSKGKYHAVATFNVTETMTREVTVMTNLKPIIEVSSPQPGIRVVMGQDVVFDASRTYDPNGDPLTFNWTTSSDDRLIYSGPDTVVVGSLLLGETSVTLTVSDGEGGVNSTTIAVEVLQATSDEDSLTRPQFNATLKSVKGGDGDIILAEATYPTPHPAELIGVFLEIRPTGNAILASGELTVEYHAALVPFGMDESTIVIAREDGGVWTPVAVTSVDTTLHKVTASITQSGTYAVMGVMPANVPPRLRVRDGAALVPPHDVEVQLGAPVDLIFEVQDELPNFATLEVGSLPEFLRLDSTTKRIYGTAPMTAGSHELSLTVTDIGGLTDTALIHLNVVGTLEPPQLWSMIVEPAEGDESTQFEVRVLYVSPDGLPPEFVRLRFDNESYDMLPEDPNNENYMGGVWYQITFRLEEDKYLFFFDTSDGRTTNSTDLPIILEVEGTSFAPTQMEWAVIIATIIAIIIILAIIRMTSERYKKLKQAHLGRDSEDSVDYITPEKAETDEEGEAPEDEADEVVDEEPDDKADRRLVDDEDLDQLDEDMERLEEELSEIDEEIEREEEEIVQIDEEIDEIIDELDEDRERAS
jgi:hypothetical protein